MDAHQGAVGSEPAAPSASTVTVAVLVFNQARFVAECLDSVAESAYPLLEILIVDDASTDTSVAKVQSWRNDHPQIPTRLIARPSNVGVPANLNAALRGAQGRYVALVAGTFGLPAGRIEAPIGRSTRNRTRMSVTAAGREAVTTFAVQQVFEAGELPGPASLIAVELHTGRTHQIRVHLAHVHHPVVGDPTYGRPAQPLAAALGLTRPFLHAARLAFAHPVTGAPIDRSEPLPADLEAALEQARRLAGNG